MKNPHLLAALFLIYPNLWTIAQDKEPLRIIQQLNFEVLMADSGITDYVRRGVAKGTGEVNGGSENPRIHPNSIQDESRTVSNDNGIHEKAPFVTTTRTGNQTHMVMEYWNGTSNISQIRIGRRDESIGNWIQRNNLNSLTHRMGMPSVAYLNSSYLAVASHGIFPLTNSGDIYFDMVNTITLNSEGGPDIDTDADNDWRPFLVSDEHPTSPYLYVSYQTASSPFKVTVKRSLNSGASWTQTFSSTTTVAPSNTSLAVDKEGLSYVYLAYIAGYQLYFSRSSNNGAIWTNPVSLNLNANLEHSSIAAWGQVVVIFFQRFYSDNDVDPVFIYSTNRGGSWSGPVTLTEALTYDGLGTVCVSPDGSAFYAAYRTGTRTGAGNSIKLVTIPRSNPAGYTESSSLVSDNISSDDFVSTSAANAFVSIGYATLSGGNYDLHYFRRTISAQPPPPSLLSITSNPASIQYNGSSTSLINATVRDGNANPVSGQQVNFEISLSGLGGSLFPESATTNSSGVAQTTYSPSGTGTALIRATAGSLTATTPVQVTSAGANTYTINPLYRLLSRTATSATYELDPYVTYTSNGQPVEATNITITTTLGTFQNGLQSLTDNLGDGRGPGRIDPPALLTTTTSGLASITYVVGPTVLTQTLELIVGEVPQVAAFISSLPSGGTDDREPEINWSPSGDLLAAVPGRIWRFPSLNTLYEGLTAYAPRVLSFSMSAKKIVSDRSSDGFCVYNLETNQLTLGSPSGIRAQSICWSDQTDEIKFAIANSTSGRRNEINIFTGAGFEMSTLSTGSTSDPIRSVDWKGNYLAAVTEAGVIYVFNTSTMSLVWSRSDLGNPQKYSAKISPDRTKLAVLGRVYSSTAPNLHIFNILSSTPIAQFVVPSGAVNSRYYSIDWSPDGTRLLCGGDNGYLRIINASSGIDEYRMVVSGNVYGVRWSPTGVIAAATSLSNTSLFAPFDNEGPTIAFHYPPSGFVTTKDTVTITGTVKDVIGLSAVEYSLDGSNYSTLPLSAETTFAHVITLNMGQTDIKVRATDRGMRQTIASRTVFRTSGALSVTWPDSNAVWYSGRNEMVIWSSAGIEGNVRIELSTNGGQSYLPTPLVAGTPNDGSEIVVIPSVPPSSSCRVRVTSTSNASTYGESAGTFWILTPTSTSVSNMPSHFALLQNYPNPWNPTTRIRYALPTSCFVTLTIFNFLGQEVAQLVSREEPPGFHEVIVDGRGLSSGVYFYRLSAGEFVETKKLLLLR